MEGHKRTKLPKKEMIKLRKEGWSLKALSLESGLPIYQVRNIVEGTKGK